MKYVLAAVIGLIYGGIISFINAKLMQGYIDKRKNDQEIKSDSKKEMNQFGFYRQVINIAAIVVVFLLKDIIPLPFVVILASTLIGMAVISYYFLWKLSKKY